MLAEAMADGRLSHDEYSERLPVALSARTLGELAELTTDLAAPEHQPVQLGDGQPVTALFTTTGRRGRWVVPGTMTCVAAFGEVVLDLREAILQDRHVVLTVYALFGKVRLIVPPGVEVVVAEVPTTQPLSLIAFALFQLPPSVGIALMPAPFAPVTKAW